MIEVWLIILWVGIVISWRSFLYYNALNDSYEDYHMIKHKR